MLKNQLWVGLIILTTGFISGASTLAKAEDGANFGILGHLLSPADTTSATEPAPQPALESEAKAAPVEKPAPSDRKTARHVASSATAGAYHSLIAKHAGENGVPAGLAAAVVQIESRYNARIVHAGNFGLMQIKPQTARGVGFAGSASALLDPDTNLRYGVKYLAVAYRKAGGDTCGALRFYQGGLGSRGFSGANRAYCRKAKAIMASR